MKPVPKKTNHTKGELHPRNLHRAPYDFARLVAACPQLKKFLEPHPLGGLTLDFAKPAAVMLLNRALLKVHYGIVYWEIPDGYLCPPIPSRADYLHHVADLLAGGNSGVIPRGPNVRVLDIGVGANAVYPLVGASVYGWSFVGTDVDPVSISSVQRIVAGNPALAGRIEARLQPDHSALFDHVVRPGERFDLCVCNPPFHASPEEAASGTLRKLRNLGSAKVGKAVLNFGGQSNELWCPGGERAFVSQMIQESLKQPELCRWFTTLVSKQASLPALERELARAKAKEVRTLVMFAGQKQSRVLAWRLS